MKVATCRDNASFALAFAAAKAAGCGGFWWRGCLFNTKRADDPAEPIAPVILEITDSRARAA